MNKIIDTDINTLLNKKRDEIIKCWIDGATKEEIYNRFGHFGKIIIENETSKIIQKLLITKIKWFGVLIIVILCVLFFR